MARHLALDWDYQQLRIVAATVRAGEFRIEQAVLFEEEQSPNLAEAEALGRHLRERLKAARIVPAPVLACVGRDRVILREVRYPSVAAAEEPAIVRFQVLKELTDAPAEVIIDYIPLDEEGPSEERRALVLTTRRELLTAYQTLCHAAGLKLLALTPRPFGTLACLRESFKKWEGTGAQADVPKNGSPHAAVAMLTAADNWSEFCLVRGDNLIVARSLPAGPTLAAEVRRNIAVYTAQSPRHVVSCLYLAGNGESQALQESLQEVLAIPVRTFDPFVGAEDAAMPRQNRGAFAGAVGLLRAQGDGRRLPINFISPKKPEVARDPNKRLLAVAAGIAAVLLIGSFSYCYAQLAALDNRIASAKLEALILDKRMPQIEEEDKHFKALTEWSRGNVCWLDELYDLTAMFPDPMVMRLSEFKGELPVQIGSQDGVKDNKPIAKMTLTIGTRIPDSVDGLVNQLTADRGHYVPDAKQRLHDTSGKDSAFPLQFKEQIDVVKQPPDKYTRALAKPTDGIRLTSDIRSQASYVASRERSPADRKRLALPQGGGGVTVVPTAPLNEHSRGPTRTITPTKTPPAEPAHAPVEAMQPVHDYRESFQAILDANSQHDDMRAKTVIDQARRAEQKMNRAVAPAPAVAAPATAAPVAASSKGEKKK